MEINTFIKSVSRVSARVAYVYPSTYRAMISSLAPDIVYVLLNSMEEVFVERFACTRLYGPEELPRSLETKSPLKDFKLILTTLHYEPDIVNLARLLLAGGLSVLSRDREEHVVIAGGPACMENPVPYSDVVDACVIGEAEATLPEVISLWMSYGDKKKRFLEELARLDYVYIAGYDKEKVVKRHVSDLDTSFYPIRQVENTEVEPVYGRGFKLEVSRGCPFWCSFCIETRVFQPYRERSPGVLAKLVEEGMKYSIGGKRVVLYALAFPVSRDNAKLLEYLSSEGYRASIPSLRATPLLEKYAEVIKQLGQRTLTIAPESFSPTIQRALFKYVGVLDYLNQLLERLLQVGFDLKLYLIYGFKGLESVDDIKLNASYIKKLVELAKKYKRRVSVSLNPLIPKPHTIFQWIGMMGVEELAAVLREYRNLLRGVAEYRLLDIDWAVVQAQLALSTKPLGGFIKKWAEYGGSLAGWRRAVRELGVDYKYVFTGYKSDEELPWSSIDLGGEVEKVTASQYHTYKKVTSART
jgi:radical SAM superfamily enzyme YgiQ (UPF0313 family)